jgi:excinuclease UvrABC ATPase subunit
VIAEGTPEDVAENGQSLTGSFLKRLFLMDAARARVRQPSERAA